MPDTQPTRESALRLCETIRLYAAPIKWIECDPLYFVTLVNQCPEGVIVKLRDGRSALHLHGVLFAAAKDDE